MTKNKNGKTKSPHSVTEWQPKGQHPGGLSPNDQRKAVKKYIKHRKSKLKK